MKISNDLNFFDSNHRKFVLLWDPDPWPILIMKDLNALSMLPLVWCPIG